MFVLAINTAFPIISIFFFYHYIIAVLQFFYKVKINLLQHAKKGATLVHATYTGDTTNIETKNKEAGFQSSVDLRILLHNWIIGNALQTAYVKFKLPNPHSNT